MRRRCRRAAAPAGFHIDDGLPDHGAAAHAAKKAAGDVADALGDTFAVGLASGFGNVVNQLQGEQAFDQPYAGQHEGIGQNDQKGIQREGEVRQVEAGEPAGDAGEIAHGFGVNAEQCDGEAGDEDGNQRGRDEAGEFGQPVGDGHGDDDQAEHDPQRGAAHPVQDAGGVFLLKMAELCEKNDDG